MGHAHIEEMVGSVRQAMMAGSPHWRNAGSWTLTVLPRRVACRERVMDKDRVAGSAKVVKGKVKSAVGKVIGDGKLEAEGKADQVEGKVQNAVGGVKDTLRGK